MPQLDQILDTFGSQLFWLVITFGLIYMVIGRSMLPKIQGTVDMREKRITDDVEAARLAHKQADELEESYKAQQVEARDDAQTVIVAARNKAAKSTEKRLHEADKRVADQIAAAEAELATQRDTALADLETSATDAVQDIFAKLTGNTITRTQAQSAVKGAIKDV